MGVFRMERRKAERLEAPEAAERLADVLFADAREMEVEERAAARPARPARSAVPPVAAAAAEAARSAFPEAATSKAVYEPTEDEWLDTLPEAQGDEFLVAVKGAAGHQILFCCIELSWYEDMDIEWRCWRTTPSGDRYFSHERRKNEVMKKAIRWVADSGPRRLLYNRSGNILSLLSDQLAEDFWKAYEPHVTLGLDEAQQLKDGALAYFKGEAQEGVPVPPIVPFVDMMSKYGRFTQEEIMGMKRSRYEVFKVIELARAEARSELRMREYQREYQHAPSTALNAAEGWEAVPVIDRNGKIVEKSQSGMMGGNIGIQDDLGGLPEYMFPSSVIEQIKHQRGA